MRVRKEGFTLIELLIVIAIILILIAIALPNFLEAQIRAKVAKASGEIRTIATAQESYFLDWNTYTYDCHDENTALVGIPSQPNGCVQLTTPISYIKELPQDPFGVHESTGGNSVNEGIVPFYAMCTGLNPKTLSKLLPMAAPYDARTPPFRELYIVYSGGPSKKEPGDPQQGYPHVPPNVPWVLYAPTNGTKSFGGIMTTGGVAIELPHYHNLNQDAHL